MRRAPRPRRLAALLVTTVTAVTLVLFMFPIYWIVTMAFKDFLLATRIPPVWLFVPTLENFQGLFQSEGFGRPLVNSVLIALAATVLSLAIGAPAAYALARFRFRLSGPAEFFILFIRMLPTFALVVPLFVLLSQARWLGPHGSVIFAHTLIGVPLVVWLLRAYFASVSPDLEHAAMIDGCSRLGALRRVTLPVAAPGIVAAGVLAFIGSWNDFVYALILGGETAKTMPVTLAGLITQIRAEWGFLAAGGTLTMAPVLVIALLVRRYFLSGLAFGSEQ
jgi:multiple sugar transport system permease protein